jgi:flagellar hook assembly protein FlgD
VNRVDVGETGALSAYRFEPEDVRFDSRKPATLEFDAPMDDGLGVAVWDATAASWLWLGGTRDGTTLRLGVTQLGVYGLVRGSAAMGVHDAGFRVRCQPRAFSPNGGSTFVTFYLRDASRVTVKVYHGSGSYVTRLADGEFRAGEHALVWDGRDEDGSTLPNGLYVVHVATRFAESQTVVLLWNP